jgi:chemotaxis signal transduction protein
MKGAELAERSLLEQRARELAQPLQLTVREETGRLLLFARGAGRYAIDTRYLIQLVPLSGYSQLPFASLPCMGVAVGRGELVALFDLPVLTGEAPGSAHPKGMLLCGQATLEFGLAVDEALELVEPAKELSSGCDAHGLVTGIDARGFVVIDGPALLSDPRLSLEPERQEDSP